MSNPRTRRGAGSSTSAAREFLTQETEEQLVEQLRSLAGAERDHALGKLTDAEVGHVRRSFREAEERLVNSHQPLVRNIARRYQHQGVDLDDLIAEGNIGLLAAARLFPHRGRGRFAAYAAWRVRAEVALAAAVSGYPMRVPQRVAKKVRRFQRSSAELMATGQPPNRSELQQALGVSSSELAELEILSLPYTSLNRPVGDGTLSLGDLLYYRDQADLECQQVEATEVPFELNRAFVGQERELLRLRFGFDRGEPRSVGQIAEHFNVNPVLVRQFLVRALARARHPSRDLGLRDLIETSTQVRHSTTADNVGRGTGD